MPSSSTSSTSGSDAAYQTLRRLLEATPANRKHVDMLDPQALYGSIGHYLSAMALVNVSDFSAAIVTSPALWTPPHERGDHTRDAVDRANGISQALAFATHERLALIAKVVKRRGAARSAPAELQSWLQAVRDGIAAGMARPVAASSLAQLAMLTGLVQGVAQAQAQSTSTKAKSRLRFRLREPSEQLGTAWGEALAPMLAPGADWRAEFGAADDAMRTAALTLAASVVDVVPVASWGAVADAVWIERALPLLLRVFEPPHADGLFQDVEAKDGALYLAPGGVSDAWRARVQDHALYAHAGPLARLLAAALRRLGETQSPVDYAEALDGRDDAPLRRLRATGDALERAWTASRLAGAPSDQIHVDSRAVTTKLWQVFKTFLFTQTLLLDAVVATIVEQCPSPAEVYAPTRRATNEATRWPAMPTSNTPAPYLALLSATLDLFSASYWITSTFSLDGFESYRVVFYSALDVLSRDAAACTQLVSDMTDAIWTRFHDVPGGRSARDASVAQRLRVTYALLVIELLTKELPPAMIDGLVLPMCRPYLEDTQYQDAFESAHSVVLALYVAHAPNAKALTPFYLELLLRCFPAQLTAPQLEMALTTVVGALSNESDSLAWWCIETVDDAISTAVANGDTERAQALAMCLAALVPRVNLVLLRSLITKLRARLLERPDASADRVRLVERVHESLGQMDAATRTEAMRWWLEDSPRFTAGMA